jgi:hypothetical protein
VKDIQSMLRSADPVRREGGLSRAASDRMRQRIQSGLNKVPPVRQRLFPPLPVAAVAVVLLSAVIGWVTIRGVRRQPWLSQSVDSAVDTRDTSGARQLQFFTPGGTRVLWTLYPKAAEAR